MANSPNGILELARLVNEDLAGQGLTPTCAKLYSQHTRLTAGQPGLRGWRANEPENRLNDAVKLLQAAFIEREAQEERWFEAALRAAEILEWLSHPELNTDRLPLQLLAAATYQLAGYPARAMGLLKDHIDDSSLQSNVLRELLRGDFASLLNALTDYWAVHPRIVGENVSVSWEDDALLSIQLRQLVEVETASSLGIICASMRWGDTTRIDPALRKLIDVAAFMLNGEDRYSWLLAKLVAETCRTFLNTSLARRFHGCQVTFKRPVK